MPGTGFFAGLGKEAETALKYAMVFSLACWLLAGLFLGNVLLSTVLGLLCFFPALLLLLYYPKIRKRHYAGLVEADLPFLLMNIAIELNLGVSFARAIQHCSDGKGACAKELRVALREVEDQGASMQEALRHFSERVESQMVKRAATQLSAAFEQGSAKNCGSSIKRIAAEILARQRAESKMFSGKMVVFSLLFIAVSAIVPALFQSFSIVGSVVLHMNFTPLQLFLIIALGFPMLDLAVLLYIRSKTPVFLRMR